MLPREVSSHRQMTASLVTHELCFFGLLSPASQLKTGGIWWATKNYKTLTIEYLLFLLIISSVKVQSKML